MVIYRMTQMHIVFGESYYNLQSLHLLKVRIQISAKLYCKQFSWTFTLSLLSDFKHCVCIQWTNYLFANSVAVLCHLKENYPKENSVIVIYQQ